MPRYFRQDIRNDPALPRPAVGPLLGQQVARRAPVVAGMRAQDRVVTQSRRIVLQVGKGGATSWMVPNTDPDSATQTYPLRDAARIVARSQFRITPGTMLQLRALVSLSGQTQIAGFTGVPPVPHYFPGGCQGIIRLTSTWDDGGTPVQRVHEVALPASGEEYGGAPTNAGGAWASMRTVKIPLITPQPLNTVVRERRWSQPTVVTLELAYVGGARVHHCVVSEVPHVVAMESDDPTWTSHVLGSSPGGQAPLVSYPFQRLSETSPDGDPRGGAWHLSDVANAQARYLGPTLVHFTSYDEDGEAVTIAEAAPRIATSTSFVGLANSSITAWSATEGHSMSPGSYARTRDISDPAALPNSGVIPVRLRAFCRGSDGSTNSGGVLRFQSSPHEWIDLEVASGAAAGWRSIVGHVRCGAGPGDPAVGQLFFRRTGGAGGFSVWDCCLEYGDAADP